MFKKTLFLIVFPILVVGCAGVQTQPPPPQEVVVKVQAAEPTDVNVQNGDNIHKSMQIRNQEGTLSNLSFICKDEAYVKIFSALTVADVTNMWNDICVLTKTTNIRNLNLFINSPGGDAFSGLALADQIERAKKSGFRVIAHASGIVASAAVPVFAVCTERLAAPGTIFMVHETSIWKWPGRETASDIRSQNRLMNLLRDRYIQKLTQYSALDREEWEELEHKTTWFSAEKAKSWGLVDRIE
ncbi:MAG: ATP-dependent Clp protease proteolytic subunit [Deltaproteobacteria bacterium]|nr:MAG: ATP-dependent Clp protease proteolytic subunit [Deltaproteobacteria bacterium]